MRFEADGVNARVGADTARERRELVVHVRLCVVNHNRAALCGEPQTFGEAVNGDDALRAQKEGALDCEQTDGAAAPHGDGVAFFDSAVLRGHVSGREDV